MAASVLQTVGGAAGSTLSMSAYTAGSRLLGFAAGRGGGHIFQTGWTHLGDFVASSDNLCAVWRASAGASTSLTFSNDGATVRQWVSEIGGVNDPLTPVTSSVNTTSIGNDTLTRNGVLLGSMLMLGVVGSAADAWTGGLWTQSANWTEVQDFNASGHPFPMSAYQLATSAGNYSATPVHGFNWNGWSPRGEAMLMIEFPVTGGARAFGVVL